MSRRHTPAWAAVRAKRAARRAIDPQVQARRVRHEQRAQQAQEKTEDAA